MARVSFVRLFSLIVLGAAALASTACIAEIELNDCLDPACPEGGGLGSSSCPDEGDPCQDEALNDGIVVPQHAPNAPNAPNVAGISVSTSRTKPPTGGRADANSM
jgi:hypothetical protein